MFRSERKIMKILAIESSCDETAAAVVEDGRNIISSVVASQVEEHKLYGGVVPEIASRRHAEAIVPVVRQALEDADFVYAKNWSCPGVKNKNDYGKILSKGMDWTIDTRHMSWTNNGYFMHCLPVRRGLIVSDDVIESDHSLVIPEAANREISAEVVIKRLLESL